eukprot:Awhi_evm1s7116
MFIILVARPTVTFAVVFCSIIFTIVTTTSAVVIITINIDFTFTIIIIVITNFDNIVASL